MLRYIVGVAWVGRDHYVQCNELRDVLAVFGRGLASLAAGAMFAASYSVFGESCRMILPLQAVYIAWAFGLAYTPSSLYAHSVGFMGYLTRLIITRYRILSSYG